MTPSTLRENFVELASIPIKVRDIVISMAGRRDRAGDRALFRNAATHTPTGNKHKSKSSHVNVQDPSRIITSSAILPPARHATMNHSRNNNRNVEIEEEKRWEDSTLHAEDKNRPVSASHALPPSLSASLHAAANHDAATLASLANTDDLWNILQQRLWTARQQLAVAQEAWRKAVQQREQLDQAWCTKYIPDEQYDAGRHKMKAEIARHWQAVVQASAVEKQLLEQLVLLQQQRNHQQPPHHRHNLHNHTSV